MNQAIDAALEPHEYLSEDGAMWSPGTITIEIEEHRKLMRIAGAVYAHLHQGASLEVLHKACDDYSAYCGVITRRELDAIERMKLPKKTETACPALTEISRAMRENESPRLIRKRCERLIIDYADNQWKRKGVK